MTWIKRWVGGSSLNLQVSREDIQSPYSLFPPVNIVTGLAWEVFSTFFFCIIIAISLKFIHFYQAILQKNPLKK